jgi:hypothetical protein
LAAPRIAASSRADDDPTRAIAAEHACPGAARQSVPEHPRRIVFHLLQDLADLAGGLLGRF